MFQVFPHHILINKTRFIKYLVLLSKYGGGRPEKCLNVQFEGKKRTFMHVSGLPPPFFDDKIIL